ncbi:hypothetical protein [uncultured Roseibium sp.]|uniref:hypothetical protein n=1 Tax=uncultured Roseibium sp. TaxID=1936171 RepID=UPI0032168DC7
MQDTGKTLSPNTSPAPGMTSSEVEFMTTAQLRDEMNRMQREHAVQMERFSAAIDANKTAPVSNGDLLALANNGLPREFLSAVKRFYAQGNTQVREDVIAAAKRRFSVETISRMIGDDGRQPLLSPQLAKPLGAPPPALRAADGKSLATFDFEATVPTGGNMVTIRDGAKDIPRNALYWSGQSDAQRKESDLKAKRVFG